jgi:hypothetical protein
MSAGATVIVIGIVVLAAYLIVCGTVLHPRCRRRFCSNREPMGDDEFAAHLGVAPADANVLALIRRSYAAQCHVPAEMIHPTDDCVWLNNNLMLYGLDIVMFVMEVDRELGRKIPHAVLEKVPRYSKNKTFGSWAVAVLCWLNESCAEAQPT